MEGVDMNFVNRFVAIFVSPTRVFEDIRERRVGWVQPWLMVAILYMLVTYLGLPIQRALLELNPAGIAPDQIDKQIEVMDKLGFVWVLLAPIGVLFVSLVVSGLTYIVVTIMSREATFKQYFTLSMFTDVIAILGQLVSVAVVRLRGVDAIADVEEGRFSLSLRTLAPPDSSLLKGLLGSFEFFTLWSFVLLVLGLMHVFKMTRAQAVAVIVPIWIVYVVMLVLGEAFGGMGG
jgi:membrane protein, antimicrobial resistance system